MKIAPNVHPVGISAAKNCKFDVATTQNTIRVYTYDGRLLDSNKIARISSVEDYSAEGFRKYILLSVLPTGVVPPGGVYFEAQWEEDGLRFYSHGTYKVARAVFCYSVRLLNGCLDWQETWRWPNCPESGQIRTALNALITNYRATNKLVAYLQGLGVGCVFDHTSKALKFNGVAMTADHGDWNIDFDVQEPARLHEAATALKTLHSFLTSKPKNGLAAHSSVQGMSADIELA